MLDSDSVVPRDFVSRMVAYAEHPSNSDVACFESVIVPWNVETLFV